MVTAIFLGKNGAEEARASSSVWGKPCICSFPLVISYMNYKTTFTCCIQLVVPQLVFGQLQLRYRSSLLLWCTASTCNSVTYDAVINREVYGDWAVYLHCKKWVSLLEKQTIFAYANRCISCGMQAMLVRTASLKSCVNVIRKVYKKIWPF